VRRPADHDVTGQTVVVDGGGQASAGSGGVTGAPDGAPGPDETFGPDRRLALLDALPEAIVVIDDGARVVWINRTLRELTGFELEEVVGDVILDYVHPDDEAYMLWSFEARSSQEGRTGLVVQTRVLCKDGSWLMGEIVGRALFDDPAVGAMVVTFRDLSRQAALADSPARLRSMVDRTTDVVLLLSGDGEVVYANRRLTALLGHDCDRIVGSSWLEVVDGPDREAAAAELAELVAAGDQATTRWRASLVSTIDRRHPVELHAVNHLADPVIEGLIVAARDITELVAMEAELVAQRDALAHEATHDHLTGLPNRAALRRHVEDAIRRRSLVGQDVVVLFVDLDGFKAVNDGYGHDAGDRVLQATAERLRAVVRDGDVVARHGGDEFVVLLEPAPDQAATADLVQRITAAVGQPVDVGGRDARVGASVGVSRASAGATDVDALLRSADAAMYDAKRSAR
jgi:diguanylate cyclase (GGDEF)-like protein/PAS domain S-box-containing protein